METEMLGESVVTPPNDCKDIKWRTFWAIFLAVWIANGIFRDSVDKNDAPLIELALFYWGHTISSFTFPALIVAPLHFVGKRLNTGYDSPRLIVAIWGIVLTASMSVMHFIKS